MRYQPPPAHRTTVDRTPCRAGALTKVLPLALLLMTATVALTTTGHPAAAQTVTPSGDGVRDAVVGKTIDLDTPLGKPITITYKENGGLSATVGAALGLYLGAASDRGRWWVENGRLCQKFFKWLEAETSCLRLRIDGNRIAWTRDDGKSGTATITTNGPVRAQTGYGLGGGGLAPATLAAEQKPPGPAAADPEPQTAAALAPETRPPETRLVERTPVIEPPVPRPVLASLTPAAGLVPPSPVAVTRPPAHAVAPSLPRDWSIDLTIPDQSAAVHALVSQARHANAHHRWCHEIRDFRLLLRPQSLDAEAPELMTATRHLHAPDAKDVPVASCVVPSPALQAIARQLLEAR